MQMVRTGGHSGRVTIRKDGYPGRGINVLRQLVGKAGDERQFINNVVFLQVLKKFLLKSGL